MDVSSVLIEDVIDRLGECIIVLEDNKRRLAELKVLKPRGMEQSIHSVIEGLDELQQDLIRATSGS